MRPLTDARRALFEVAFTDGHQHVEDFADSGPTPLVFRLHEGAKVRTRGGQLEVGGSLFPADRTLPAGEFVVQCARCGPPKAGVSQSRNAYARVVFSPGAPVKWEQLEGQVRVTSQAISPDAETEEWVKTIHLRVEDGSVAFAEPGFGERLEQLVHEHGAEDVGELQQLSTAGLVDFRIVEANDVLQTAELEGRRSVAMQSGVGDGTYGVYGGYAADGSLTRLVVDFDLVG
jgi:hypothetical protein